METKRKLAVCLIFCTICFERAAYYSLLGDLATFLNTQLNWRPNNTAVAVLLFSGMSWISCFIGGILGDSKVGRYDTIATGLLLYVFGFISLPILADINQIIGKGYGPKPIVVLWVMLSLLLVSIGEGFFKSNMSPFGADQIGGLRQKQIHRFFSIFYLFLNIGSLIGYGPVIYFEEINFMHGYLAAVACIGFSAVVFMVPKSCVYYCNENRSNVLKQTWKIFAEAWRKKRLSGPGSRSNVTELEKVIPLRHWLDRAAIRYGGSFPDIEVNEVKALCDFFPPFGFLVIYYILFYQVFGTFLLQGIHMNTTVLGFSVPAAWLSLLNVIFVLLFIPTVDYIFYPLIAYCGFNFKHLQKISFGMILGSLSMVFAALVERRRLNTQKYLQKTISGTDVNATDLMIYYQIPQYAVSGISEVFVSVTGLEYAYTHAPKSMRSIATGLFFVANGFGSFIGSLLIGIADACGFKVLRMGTEKIPTLEGNLDYFFYALAGVNAVAWLFFVRYIHTTQRSQKTDWTGRRDCIREFLRQNTRSYHRSQYNTI